MLKIDEGMQDPKLVANELYKPMHEFAAPAYMAMFGRPLWLAYDSHNMNNLAKFKLIGGRHNITYNARDVHDVFAALSFRPFLDAVDS